MATHDARPLPLQGTSSPRGVIVACLILVAILAALLRWMGLSRSLWLDEYISLETCCRAQGVAWWRGIALQALPYHLLLSLWGLIDVSVPFLRIPSVLFGVTTVAVTMWGAWRRSVSAAVMAGGLLACSPIMLRYGLELRAYGLVVAAAAVAFAIVATPGGLERRGSRAWLSLAIAVALATHPTAVMLVPALVFVWAATRPVRRAEWAVWAPVLMPPAVVAAIVTLVSLRLHRGSLGAWWMPEPTLPVMAGVFRVLAGSDRVAWPLDGVMPAAVVAAVALAVAAPLWRAPDGGPRERRLGAALFGAGGVYLGGLVACSLVFPVLWPRTALVALVPAASGLALLIATHRRAVIRVAGAVFLVVVCGAWVTDWVQAKAWTAVEPWREAASRIERAWRPGDVAVFCPDYVAGPILYYAPRLEPTSTATLRLGDDAEAISRKLAAARHPTGRGSAGIVAMIRADFSVRAQFGAVDHLLSVLSAARRDHDVRLVVLTASDVEVVPGLADTTGRVMRLAAERLGPPSSTSQLSPWLVEAVFLRAAPR